MISTLLDRLFQRSNVPSGAKVKQRLKFILAHDRAAIEPQVFENMRHEIMRVVSKYVELDEGSLDIRLESDKRMTALIANLPIRMVREELPDLVSLFGADKVEITDENSAETDAVALEMDRFAEAALDAIASQEIVKSRSEDSSFEDTNEISERTTEVTSKLRTAANKLQNVDALSENTGELVQPDSFEAEQVEEIETDQLELSLGIAEDPKPLDIAE
ncbi:cell division topological specificity factor MinE [Pseudanabaena biceps]|nr:cell division topological specificity factor MinE [Pseudanabaena biceps]